MEVDKLINRGMFVNMNKQEAIKIFATRLSQARKICKLSLRELAERMDGLVSYNALHKYENQEMMPDGAVLVKLCEVLGRPVDFFFRPASVSLGNIEFRKKSSLSAREIESLKEKSADFFERYLEVESILGISSRFVNPLSGLVIKDHDDVEAAAASIRISWNLGEDPLPSVISLLEEKHIKLLECECPDGCDGFSGVADEVLVVVLNKSSPSDRKRLTALHELGHLVLRFDPSLSHTKIEKLCHDFAGALLIPRNVFAEVFGGRRSGSTTKELVAIKQRWGISCAAIMMRAEKLGLISSSSLSRFFILWRKWGYAIREPGELANREWSDRFECLIHRAVSADLISISKAASLSGKPLKEFRDSYQACP